MYQYHLCTDVSICRRRGSMVHAFILLVFATTGDMGKEAITFLLPACLAPLKTQCLVL